MSGAIIFADSNLTIKYKKMYTCLSSNRLQENDATHPMMTVILEVPFAT
jgi:hypothetical protein